MSRLLIIGDLTATPLGDGRVLVSKKFVTGMQMYAEHWPGTLSAVVQPAELDRENLDVREWTPASLGFDLEVRSFEGDDFRAWFRQQAPDVVMGGAHYLLMDLPALCAEVGARFVCCTEYDLKTNIQIIQSGGDALGQRARSAAWMVKHMWERRRMVRAAAGLQANGTPTYEAYFGENDNALLYFDSRITPAMIATDDEVAARAARMRDRDRPLRLLFSGRLNAMKGADALLDVAHELQQRGVPFHLDICGDGALRSELEVRAREWSLDDVVTFKGVLDFEAELVPYVRREIDVFVCCHRQGDPSCTYLETAACGVPILGFANNAFVGILKRYQIGRATPMNDARALAREIDSIRATPRLFDAYVKACLRFARENTYDRVFAQRIDHLRSVAGV